MRGVLWRKFSLSYTNILYSVCEYDIITSTRFSGRLALSSSLRARCEVCSICTSLPLVVSPEKLIAEWMSAGWAHQCADFPESPLNCLRTGHSPGGCHTLVPPSSCRSHACTESSTFFLSFCVALFGVSVLLHRPNSVRWKR